MTDTLIKFFKEFFYRKELEIFRVGMTNTYGIREVWRSRIKTPDGASGWRKYSSREGGGKITMSYEEMNKMINEAKHFLRKMP